MSKCERSVARLEQAVRSQGPDLMLRGMLRLLRADPVAGQVVRRLARAGGGLWRHSRRVAQLSASVAAALGMSAWHQEQALVGGFLHDAGKVLWPESLLRKPGGLDSFERELVRVHPVSGYLLLRGSAALSAPALEAVLRHHERVDGSGYPGGLQAHEVGLVTHVVAVADVYVALTDTRSYKPALDREEALRILRSQPLHRAAVDAAEEIIRRGEAG